MDSCWTVLLMETKLEPPGLDTLVTYPELVPGAGIKPPSRVWEEVFTSDVPMLNDIPPPAECLLQKGSTLHQIKTKPLNHSKDEDIQK